MNPYLEKVAQRIWAQALDNKSKDPSFFHGRDSSFTETNGPHEILPKWKKIRVTEEGLSFRTRGDHLLVETSGNSVKDVVGRKAPVATYLKYNRDFKTADKFADHHIEGLRKFNETTKDGKRIHESEFSTIRNNLRSFYRKRRFVQNAKRTGVIGAAVVGTVALANHFGKSKK